mmetsp:Transcript_57450/g.171388  ORF Transcript_57450/g.171388 Transcript_57450/m.171388 type:complete len:308 (+) Transcript_57450:767-1690(+)
MLEVAPRCEVFQGRQCLVGLSVSFLEAKGANVHGEDHGGQTKGGFRSLLRVQHLLCRGVLPLCSVEEVGTEVFRGGNARVRIHGGQVAALSEHPVELDILARQSLAVLPQCGPPSHARQQRRLLLLQPQRSGGERQRRIDVEQQLPAVGQSGGGARARRRSGTGALYDGGGRLPAPFQIALGQGGVGDGLTQYLDRLTGALVEVGGIVVPRPRGIDPCAQQSLSRDVRRREKSAVGGVVHPLLEQGPPLTAQQFRSQGGSALGPQYRSGEGRIVADLLQCPSAVGLSGAVGSHHDQCGGAISVQDGQ